MEALHFLFFGPLRSLRSSKPLRLTPLLVQVLNEVVTWTNKGINLD
jgi:hypothetical protein